VQLKAHETKIEEEVKVSAGSGLKRSPKQAHGG
jgi:hypothetical protein